MSMQPMAGAAGWLQDPSGRYEYRYWDGTSWTAVVMRGGQTESDPEPPPIAAEAPVPVVPVASAVQVGPPPSPGDRLTSLPPNEAQERISFQLAAVGFQRSYVSQGRLEADLVIKKQPNVFILLILLLIWLIPGIIYAIVASGSKTHHVALFFSPNGSGTRISVQADNEGFQALAPALAQLPW